MWPEMTIVVMVWIMAGFMGMIGPHLTRGMTLPSILHPLPAMSPTSFTLAVSTIKTD
jgi:hypothetical protein